MSIEKLKEWIRKAIDKLPQLSGNSAAMRYISWYAIFLITSAMLYLIMILVDWYISGRPNLPEMGRFIDRLTGGGFVAAIGFGAKYLVDQNHNDIPDPLEGKEGGDKK